MEEKRRGSNVAYNLCTHLLQVFVVLRMRRVITLGNYSISNLLTSCEGPFNITLHNVTAVGTVSLATDEEGKLYANNSAIDMSYDFIQVFISGIRVLHLPLSVLIPYSVRRPN